MFKPPFPKDHLDRLNSIQQYQNFKAKIDKLYSSTLPYSSLCQILSQSANLIKQSKFAFYFALLSTHDNSAKKLSDLNKSYLFKLTSLVQSFYEKSLIQGNLNFQELNKFSQTNKFSSQSVRSEYLKFKKRPQSQNFLVWLTYFQYYTKTYSTFLRSFENLSNLSKAQLSPQLNQYLLVTSSQSFIDYINQNSSNQVPKQAEQLSLPFSPWLKLCQKITPFLQKSKKQGSEISSQSLKKQYNKLASWISSVQPKSIYEEITINRFKYLIESPYTLIQNNVKKESKLYHCCAVLIGKNSSFGMLENHFHEHKNYHWPITLDSIIKHVKKTIVGFLNEKGGIIYVGMKQDHNNVVSSGITLSKSNIIQFFKWVNELCQSIYPNRQFYSVPSYVSSKEQYDFETNFKRLQNRINSNVQTLFYPEYHINYYISLQFVSIVDIKTYLDYYQQNKQKTGYGKCYLVKIKIKPGTKSQTFHLLKNDKDGQIQCFCRKDASVMRLNLAEFMEKYNQRMNQWLNTEQGKDQEQQQTHKCQNCRFFLKLSKNDLIDLNTDQKNSKNETN